MIGDFKKLEAGNNEGTEYYISFMDGIFRIIRNDGNVDL